MQIEEMTAEQVTSRVAELLKKAANGGITPAERRELDSLQDVRTRTLAAKQARDRALQEYEDTKRPKVEQLPNARKNFSAAATAVTKQQLNNVGDYDSNFLAVKQKLEQELRQPMTIENIVRVLSDGSLERLAPNPNADELHQEREQQERAQLIEEIVEDYSFDEHVRSTKRRQLERPEVTLDNLRQQVDAIRERQRLYQLTPAQIRAENAAKRAAQQASPEKPPIHVARELANREYPAMPDVIWYQGQEVPLDSKFFRLCSGEQMKSLIKTYGDAQVVARIRKDRAVEVFGE
jgi:hypothetical protein